MRKELLKTRAYAIFSEELGKHLAYLKMEISGKVLSEKFYEDARIIFHTLKGGAGFFGLEGIERRAAELEKLFQTSAPNIQLSHVACIIQEIEVEAANMPKAEFTLEDKNA